MSKSKYRPVRNTPQKPINQAMIDMLSTIEKNFSLSKEIVKILNVDVYFSHPYRAWERNSNENTNE